MNKDEVIDDLGHVISRSLYDTLKIEKNKYQSIENCLSLNQQSLEESEKTVASIQIISTQINGDIMEHLRNEMNELKDIFNVVDVMINDVIPLLQNDLSSIDMIILGTEKSQPNYRYPSMVKSWLNPVKSTVRDITVTTNAEIQKPENLIYLMNKSNNHMKQEI